jgi:microsomal epoxide hydrolase
MSKIKPFAVSWSEAYPWPPIPEVPPELPGGGWAYGCDGTYLKALCAHWTGAYDWRGVVADLNRFPQFTAEVGTSSSTSSM